MRIPVSLILAGCGLCLLLTACSPAVSRQEYVPFIEAQLPTLTEKKEIGNLVFEATVLPAAYTVLKHQQVSNKAAYQQALAEANQYYYVAFRIDTKNRRPVMEEGVSDQLVYDARVNYFAFALQQKMVLIADKDTLPCAIHHFEQFFTVAPHVIITAAFAKPRGQKADYERAMFQYRDEELGVGIINLLLDTEKAAAFSAPEWN